MELRLLAQAKEPSIIAIVETWLDGSHSDNEVFISGYKLLRKDRSDNPNRGGVCVFARNELQVTALTMADHQGNCSCENLWIKVSSGVCRNFILGVVYRSPRNNDFTSHVVCDLESVAARSHPLVVVGDFNMYATAYRMHQVKTR